MERAIDPPSPGGAIVSERTSTVTVLAVAWNRLRASPRLTGAILFVTVVAFALAASVLPSPRDSVLAELDRFAFDLQMRMLREHAPRALADDIVLIGIDEETENAFPEPIALWHRRLADVSHVLAAAKPRAVGFDVVLPERSFDSIVPGLDLAMMRSLIALSRAAPLVYVQTVNSRGEPIAIQPNYRAILREPNLGLDQQLKDPDGVARRFDERGLSANQQAVPTLGGQMLRSLGIPVGRGYIDYSVGAPLEYIPLHRVAAMDEVNRDRAFKGRIVLIGNLTRKTDRWNLPVKLLARDPEAAGGNLALSQPGVLTHAQVLRSHLADGLLQPASIWVHWILALGMAAVVLVRPPPAGALAIALLAPALLLAASLAAIRQVQLVIPLATLVACLWGALVLRGAFGLAEAMVDRVRLRQSFAGQVSPAVMKEMLGGTLSPGVSGQLADVCVLFSDVRDFTTLSEHLPPKVVTHLLQRYFDRMVAPVHRFDGTVDKFIGDGMMVLFGAPRRSADPCGNAVQCALAMMQELDRLNLEFEREGLPVLTIGIGINFGTVTVGNIGSSERHNYSAIGDAVNVAARVEGLTKDLGRKILITEAVVSRIEDRFHFDPLGSHNVKGHSPVNVWGIRTARATPAVVEAEAVT